MDEAQIVIGKGTWIDKVADTLIKREKKLGRDLSLIRVGDGLGASGIPHIGSMADAVRAYGIALALQNFGFKSELIAYSDDMDGLRKIPQGLPNFCRLILQSLFQLSPIPLAVAIPPMVCI